MNGIENIGEEHRLLGATELTFPSFSRVLHDASTQADMSGCFRGAWERCFDSVIVIVIGLNLAHVTCESFPCLSVARNPPMSRNPFMKMQV